MAGCRQHQGWRSQQRSGFRSLRMLSLMLIACGALVMAVHAGSEGFAPVAYSRKTELRPGFAGQPTHATSYFAILGAVKQSAVFAGDEAEISLAELVDRAGGLNTWASPVAHIIRDAHDVRHVVFHPGSSEPVRSGDVVVFHRLSGPTSADIVMTAEGVPAIPVAFINLVAERPVVVPLDLSKATIAGVREALTQPKDFGTRVRVFRKNSDPSLLSRPDDQMPLLSGDVLILEPPTGTGDEGQLLNALALPPAIPLREGSGQLEFNGANGGLQRSLHRQSSVTTASRPNVDENPRSRSQDPIGPTTPTTTDEGASELPFTDLNVSLQAVIDESGGTSEVPGPPSEAAELASVVPGASGLPAPAPRDFEAQMSWGRTVDEKYEASEEPAPLPPQSTDADQKSSASSVNRLAAGVLTLSLVCFAISLIWSRLDREPTTVGAELSQSRNGSPPATRQSLDELIENRMPLLEEETRLPEGLAYFGQAIGRRRLILNQREALAGPHYAAAHEARPRTIDAAEQAVPVSKQSFSGESLRVDAPVTSESSDTVAAEKGPKALPRRGLLERVLVAMEREKRR